MYRDFICDPAVIMRRSDEEVIRLLIEQNIKLSGESIVNRDLAATARKTIETERARRNESCIPFDVGFACGLSYALGAFSGVCELRGERNEQV